MPTKLETSTRGRLSDNEYDKLRDTAIFAALKTGDPGNLDWTFRAGHDWPTKGGSPNIAVEINALRLFRPETRELALEKWQWQAERSKVAFEDIEYGSRIYRSRTLRAHLLALRWCTQHGVDVKDKRRAAVINKSVDLTNFLLDWLKLYWTLELLSYVYLKHGPQSMRIGARSAGHPLHPTQSDYAHALAAQVPFQWVKPWRYLGPHNKSPEGNLSRQIEALKSEIEASWIGLNSVDNLIASAPKWGSLVITHYYRTENGLATWVEEQSGGNTVGIAAAGCNNGEEPWCIGPSPQVWAGKERTWRQKPYHLWCYYHDDSLFAGGNVANTYLPKESHSFPTGKFLYHVLHYSNGLRKIE